MKVRVEITVGDKFIADSYEEADEVFKFRRFPSQVIKDMQRELMARMSEAIEKAITEQLVSGYNHEPTSYPVRCGGGSPYDVVGGVS